MYILIILIPLLNFLYTIFLSKNLNKNYISVLTSLFSLFTCFLSYFLFYEVCICKSICYLDLNFWIVFTDLKLNWYFLFDNLTSVMLVVVTTISSLVNIYSISYMNNDPHFNRFMSYLSLFTFFMIILITSNNYVQMFVGWEGVGLCSYLLINFWYTRIQANKAAIKAMLVNRIGDFFIILAIVTIFYTFHTFDYSSIYSLSYNFINKNINIFNYNFNVLNIISLFLFFGAVGKSAQIGLHVWLPDAMEGPTPVSALIHAATMVTAGIFVICRSSFIFEYSENTLIIVSLIGAITAFYASSIGLVQNDLKKVIAYSTCSQLGYMIFACGISGYNISMFHLTNHAFFKALLFLSAGSVIHSLNDEQDMRKMGGLLKLLPFTYSMFLIGSLALLGFPFLSGYYSKDLILELAYSKYTIASHFAFIFGILSVFCTSFYSIRLLFLTFIIKTNSNKQNIKKIHDAPIILAIPLLILSIFSIFIGYIIKDMFVGLGSNFWNNSIFIQISNNALVEAEFILFKIKILPLIFSSLGIITAIFLYNYLNNFNQLIKNNNKLFLNFYLFLNKKWFFDKLYQYGYIKTLKFSKNYLYTLLEKGLINSFSINYFKQIINYIGNIIIKIQSGFFYNYILIMIISSFSFILISDLLIKFLVI